MTDAEIVAELHMKYDELMVELEDIESKIQEQAAPDGQIMIKKIHDSLYYYTQRREGNRVVSDYIGRVAPGVTADIELQIMERDELRSRREVCLEKLRAYESAISALSSADSSPTSTRSIDGDIRFEVYYKNMLCTYVHNKGDVVYASRYVQHPVYQIFAQDKMTRYQLNEVLRLRCWEQERADIDVILKLLGLEHYEPYEIVKRTHGVSANDHIWIRFPGEKLTYEDVSVR